MTDSGIAYCPWCGEKAEQKQPVRVDGDLPASIGGGGYEFGTGHFGFMGGELLIFEHQSAARTNGNSASERHRQASLTERENSERENRDNGRTPDATPTPVSSANGTEYQIPDRGSNSARAARLLLQAHQDGREWISMPELREEYATDGKAPDSLSTIERDYGWVTADKSGHPSEYHIPPRHREGLAQELHYETGELAHSCDQCEREFEAVNTLVQHAKWDHQDESEGESEREIKDEVGQ